MAKLQQGLNGISADAKMKLHILRYAMDVPIVKLVEMMTERLWEEKQDLIANISQVKVNKKSRQILEKLKPK